MKSKDSKVPFSFPGGSMVKNPPANAGDRSSIPGPGRSHMPWSNQAGAPQLSSLGATTTEPRRAQACALQQEKPLQWEDCQCKQRKAYAAMKTQDSKNEVPCSSPKSHSQSQAQKPVHGFYLLWSQWSSASFLPLRPKNYRRHRYRGNGGPGAPQARGLVRPESNSSTATASEHSICMKRDNSYLESTEEEWLKVTNLGFTWITINTENQFTLAWQKSPILTAHYSLDSIKKQFWVENSENLHLKF